MKKKQSKLVISKNEITKPTKIAATAVPIEGERKRGTLREYRSNIEEMSKKVEEYAISLSPTNLLSVKMAMMEAIRSVERMMKERREE